MYKSKSIEVIPYDPNWHHIFETEAAYIKQVLGDNCLDIYHIGSTSVPGLASKNTIDMILLVKETPLARQQLEEIDFQYRGEFNIPLRYFFAKRGGASFNLHVYCDSTHPEIELNLMFRDYLRTHPEIRDKYAQIKQEILKEESSYHKEECSFFANHTLRKGDFIKSVLKQAGFNRVRILKCSDESEWKAAQYFRDTYFFSPEGIEDPYTWTFNHENHTHLILYEGCEIIGYAHIQFWPDQRAALRVIVIDEAQQNKGYGSQFLNLCEQWLNTLGIKNIHAESNPPSFYLKNGYIEMPFEDSDGFDNPEDIPMGKSL